MREVGSGWLMTELAPSPLLVALVQAAATLPVFLFSLPAEPCRIFSIAASC
jgi:hypothetical protein